MTKDEKFGLNLDKLTIGTAFRNPTVITSQSQLPITFEEKITLLNINHKLFAKGNTSIKPASSTTLIHPFEYCNTLSKCKQIYFNTLNTTITANVSSPSQLYRRTIYRNDPYASSISPVFGPNATIALNRNRATASTRVAAVAPSRSEHRTPEKDIRSERST
ncbi:hypothetical protein EAF04_004170 [Stromatinia cepivora]|nr:hypothetical protein EAF04_004170 [Stromatinia cepivora]